MSEEWINLATFVPRDGEQVAKGDNKRGDALTSFYTLVTCRTITTSHWPPV